ncbi:MAG TPA: SGNH/GDSL hydrolase family protein [Lacipirellulaceae bacterium]|nr:SGNH/GDSL hydrolase family protein [Lacipirellulaceae bacterium]
MSIMNRYNRGVLGVLALGALSLLRTEAFGHVPDSKSYWIGTWATSPVGLPTISKVGAYSLPTVLTIKGTIRYRIHISLGGLEVRLRFSNEYGKSALRIAAVSIAMAGDGLDAIPGSLRPITFGGRRSITIPAGAPALSDPVALRVRSLSDLLVSVYVPQGIGGFACTRDLTPTNQAVVEASDATSLHELMPGKCLATMRPLVSEVDVQEMAPKRVVVTLGDSITDGVVDPKTGERGWPGALARRLAGRGVSVVNAGISGNRLLRSFPMFGVSALARLDRDVLSVPGLRYIVLLEGINDIGMSGPEGMLGSTSLVTPKQLIAIDSQIVTRAHEHKVKVIGATLLPFKGAEYYSADKEKVREAVNEWIRKSRTFDAVVDFDMAVRDTAHPERLKKDYDSGDHLHPNLAGYRHMGEVIDLGLFN